MDFRKPFSSHNSYKQITSTGNETEKIKKKKKKLPILDDDITKTESSVSSFDGLKADMERDSRYKIWQDVETDARIRSQKSGSFDFPQFREEVTLDVGDETEEISNNNNTSETTASRLDGSKEMRVSFKINSSGTNNLSGSVRSTTSSTSFSSATMRMNLEQQEEEEEEVVVRSSSIRKTELVSKTKAKSRLIDPPQEEEQQYSSWMGTSEQLRSGLLGRQSDIEEEDDSLGDEDVPEEYRKSKMDAITLLQWLSLIAIIVALILSLVFPSWKKATLWKLHMWKWEVIFLVLICGRLVSGILIRIVVFFIERNFLLRKRVLYFVYGVKTAVQNCLWLGLVLLAWHFLFNKKVETETQSGVLLFVTKILMCFLLSTVLWLIKTLVVKVLASSFHVSTYFDRIQEALFHHYLIETLSGPPMLELSRIEEEDERAQEEIFKMQKAGADLSPDLCSAAFPNEKSGSVMNGSKPSPIIPKTGTDNGITMDDLHRMNQKNVSAWNMKRLMNIVRNVSLTTLDEQALQNTSEDESTRQIRSEKEAKAAARKIFKNVAQPGTKHIYLEDLLRFLRADEAMKTMSLFEGALVTKKITKSALKNWLVNAFRERKALALTLNDTKTAVNKLHHMISFLTAIVILVIWLIILEIATSKSLLFLTSQVVLLAFMFGNSLKTVFESIIFLFIIHPYDVGDRVVIDTIEMVVEEMNILTTVFLRSDNQKIVYPNILMWQKAIHNYNRSPDMGDAVDFCLHITTPPGKIAAIKQRILSYIDSKPEYWYPKAEVVVRDVEGLNIVKYAIWLRHRINHQNMGEKFTRRALLVEELIKILLELDIQYRFHSLDINVKTMPTVASTRIPPGWPQNPVSG